MWTMWFKAMEKSRSQSQMNQPTYQIRIIVTLIKSNIQHQFQTPFDTQIELFTCMFNARKRWFFKRIMQVAHFSTHSIHFDVVFCVCEIFFIFLTFFENMLNAFAMHFGFFCKTNVVWAK